MHSVKCLLNFVNLISALAPKVQQNELFSLIDERPITIGQFVTAEIEGRSFENVIRLPRESLRQGNQVLIVDQDNKLRTRMVDVIETNSEYIVIASGVEDGDIVNLSQLGMSVDGLLVETNTQTPLAAIAVTSMQVSSSQEIIND